VKAKKPIKAALAVVISVPLILSLSVAVSAAGIGVAPAYFEFSDSLAGKEYKQTMSVQYTAEGECAIDLSATGDIADWVTFYDFGDLGTPTDRVNALGRQWTYVVAKVNVPDDTPIGMATGTLFFKTVATESGSGQAVGLQAAASVAVEIVGKAISEGTNGTVEIVAPFLDFGEKNNDLGPCAASIKVDIRGATTDASISLQAVQDLPADASIGFELAALDAGFEIAEIAYVIRVDKANLTFDNVGRAIITMKIGRSWADARGLENINILRLGDNAQEVLPTTFVGYEEEYAVFEGVSEGGLSYFGLAVLRPLPTSENLSAGTNWGLVGGLVGGIIPVATAMGILLYRRRNA